MPQPAAQSVASSAVGLLGLVALGATLLIFVPRSFDTAVPSHDEAQVLLLQSSYQSGAQFITAEVRSNVRGVLYRAEDRQYRTSLFTESVLIRRDETITAYIKVIVDPPERIVKDMLQCKIFIDDEEVSADSDTARRTEPRKSGEVLCKHTRIVK